MQGTALIFLVLVGAGIGYLTNVLAIRLLFRPFEPVGIGPVRLQGLIPKRRHEIARSIGETIEAELLSIEELLDRFLEQMDKAEVIAFVKLRLRTLAQEKMPFFLPQQMREMILSHLDEIVDERGDELITEMAEKLIHRAATTIDLSAMIEDKINTFDLDRIESLILAIAKKELRHIELLGGVLGGIIGLIQGLLVLQFFS